MFASDMHCDGCGQEAPSLSQYSDSRIELLVCSQCMDRLLDMSEEGEAPIPAETMDRLRFYKWLRESGRISG